MDRPRQPFDKGTRMVDSSDQPGARELHKGKRRERRVLDELKRRRDESAERERELLEAQRDRQRADAMGWDDDWFSDLDDGYDLPADGGAGLDQ